MPHRLLLPHHFQHGPADQPQHQRNRSSRRQGPVGRCTIMSSRVQLLSAIVEYRTANVPIPAAAPPPHPIHSSSYSPIQRYRRSSSLPPLGEMVCPPSTGAFCSTSCQKSCDLVARNEIIVKPTPALCNSRGCRPDCPHSGRTPPPPSSSRLAQRTQNVFLPPIPTLCQPLVVGFESCAAARIRVQICSPVATPRYQGYNVRARQHREPPPAQPSSQDKRA